MIKTSPLEASQLVKAVMNDTPSKKPPVYNIPTIQLMIKKKTGNNRS